MDSLRALVLSVIGEMLRMRWAAMSNIRLASNPETLEVIRTRLRGIKQVYIKNCISRKGGLKGALISPSNYIHLFNMK